MKNATLVLVALALLLAGVGQARAGFSTQISAALESDIGITSGFSSGPNYRIGTTFASHTQDGLHGTLTGISEATVSLVPSLRFAEGSMPLAFASSPTGI